MIFLQILKIIGIILLILVGVVLFALLSILFYPIRYKANGDARINCNNISESVSTSHIGGIHGKCKWLYHILGISFQIEKDENLTYNVELRVLFFKKIIFTSDFEESDVNTEETKVDFEESDTKIEESSNEKIESLNKEVESSNKSEVSITKKSKPQKKSFFEKNIDKIRKIKKVPKSIARGIKSKIRRLKKTKDNIEEFKSKINAIVKDRAFKDSVKHVKDEIFILIKILSPKKIKGYTEFSLGEPDKTGYVTGAVSMLPFAYQEGCEIYPDFQSEKAFLKSDFDVKGSIQVYKLLLIAFRIWQDKELLRLINKIKRMF
ncbi:hypothetical protein SAMN04487761_11217 [Lachnospiraceae bacterium C7]|nr:hypothetical protein SAMN04487761_11217 [Lachnospiraceae bacterium C7]